MIDIDKLTEDQVRYIINELLDIKPMMCPIVAGIMSEKDYPQQTNNEEGDNDQQ